MPFAMNPFTNKLDYYKEGGSGTIGPTQGGTGITTYAKGDTLFASDVNVLAKLPITNFLGAQLVASNQGVPAWSQTVGGPEIITLVDDDFCYYSSSANVPYPWYYVSNGGSGTSFENGTPTPGHPGVKTLSTGTDANGEQAMVHGSSVESTNGNVILGGGAHQINWVINLPALSTITDEYAIWFGLGSGLQAYLTHPGDYAVVFRYQRTTSTNWQGITRSGGSQTIASGGSNVAVATGWNTFSIVINANATSVSFYINNTLIGTSASNIPTSASNPISLGLVIQSSAGSTPKNVDIDLSQWFHQLTTSRF